MNKYQLSLRQIEKKQVTLSYYIGGSLDSSNALIFLNGLYHGKESWIKQVRHPYFHQNYKMIFVDYRGLGNSTFKEYRPYSLSELANDIQNIYSREQISNLTLIGYSIGGIIALYFQYYYPELLKKLILINSGIRVSIHIRFMLTTFCRLLQEGADFNELVGFMYPLNHSQGYLEKMVAADSEIRAKYTRYNHDIQAFQLFLNSLHFREQMDLTFQNITIPTLFIGSELDRIFPFEDQTEIVAKLKNCHLHVIPQCGHASFIEKYNDVNQIIDDFLKNYNVN